MAETVVKLVAIMERSGGTVFLNPAQIAAIHADPDLDDDEVGVVVELSSGYKIRSKTASVEKFLEYLRERATTCESVQFG